MNHLPQISLPGFFSDQMARHLMGDLYHRSIVFNFNTRHWNHHIYADQKLINIDYMTNLADRARETLESLNWMRHHEILGITGMVIDAHDYTGWAQPVPTLSYCPDGGAFVGTLIIRDRRNNMTSMGQPISVRSYTISDNAPIRGMMDFATYLIENSSFRRAIRTAHMHTRAHTF